MVFHKEGNCVASGSSDKTIKMWDVRSHLLIQHYAAHDSAVTSLSLHDSGYYLLSASRDSTMRIWDLREGRLLFTMQSHIGPVNSAVFSRDGHFFASGGTDELVMVWKSNLYGVKAPEIDWGMGERPKSAPTITNGSGLTVRKDKGPSQPDLRSMRDSLGVFSKEVFPSSSTANLTEDEGNTSLEKTPRESRIRRRSAMEKQRSTTPTASTPSRAPATPSHRQSTPIRDSTSEKLITRNELPANLTKTLDHIIGQVRSILSYLEVYLILNV